MIHGMVDRPLVFTMDELKRLPSVIAHPLHRVPRQPRAGAAQDRAGDARADELRRVDRRALSLLLKEAGVQNGASWIVAEGAEEVKGASSIPLGKAMDDCLVAYGMNGEPIRPQQGFPLRLLVPGFEGHLSDQVSAAHQGRRSLLHDLRRLRTHQRRTRRAAALTNQIGPKSVITFPSGGQQLPGPGFYEISGLAWSGAGAVRKVEISTDGGQTLARGRTAIAGLPHGAHAVRPPPGSGTAKSACSCRAAPTSSAPCSRRAREAAKYWNKPLDASAACRGNDNTVQPWRIASDGSVHNGLA